MESDILLSRVRDAVRLSEIDGAPKFVGFLRPEETALACPLLQNRVNHCFFGGYEGAERCFLGVFPDWAEKDTSVFPIVPITFNFRQRDKLTHRDFLGSLMSLGITREKIGDILIESGRAVVFSTREISRFILTQINCVGRVGVTAEKGCTYPLPQMSERVQISNTVASLRLDCVVAVIVKTSRSSAVELIDEQKVSINSVMCQKATREVAVGDKITVRGYGKFSVVSADGVTKKGRTVLITETYK